MGAYGLMLGLQENPSTANLEKTYDILLATRPTAVNLKWSLDRIFQKVKNLSQADKHMQR